MVDFATISESGGKFYIRPLAVNLNGLSFKTRAEAEYVVNAVNNAYRRGKDEIRSNIRDLIGAASEEDVIAP